MSDETWNVMTPFPDVAELGQGYMNRADGERLWVPLPTEVEMESEVRFVIYLLDGTPAFAGAGRCIQVADQGDDIDPQVRFEALLDSLAFDERSQPVYDYIVAIRAAAVAEQAEAEGQQVDEEVAVDEQVVVNEEIAAVAVDTEDVAVASEEQTTGGGEEDSTVNISGARGRAQMAAAMAEAAPQDDAIPEAEQAPEAEQVSEALEAGQVSGQRDDGDPEVSIAEVSSPELTVPGVSMEPESAAPLELDDGHQNLETAAPTPEAQATDVDIEIPVTDPPAYAEEPQAFAEEPQAFAEEPQAFAEEPQAYAEEPQQAYAEEPQQAYAEEPQAYAEEPQAHAEEPQAYSEEPQQAYAEEPQALAVDVAGADYAGASFAPSQAPQPAAVAEEVVLRPSIMPIATGILDRPAIALHFQPLIVRGPAKSASSGLFQYPQGPLPIPDRLPR